VSCVTIKFVACAPSTDKLLPWVYPKVDCRLAFVDSGTPGRGCAYSSPDEQDGHRSGFRSRGWRPHVHRQPDHVNDLWRRPRDHNFEETQIQSGTTEASTLITPISTTRPPLPRYEAKRVDNSGLLQALDRADLRLLEASNLVDAISRKPDQAASTNFFDSCRPTRVTMHEQLETSLTITSTPTGRCVKLKTHYKKLANPWRFLSEGITNCH